MRDSEGQLQLIIDTIPSLVWTARPDGYCDYLNQRWLQYTGMVAEQAHGSGWAAAVHPDDCKGLVEYWQSCIASGTPVATQARFRRFDGSYRWFLVSANPLRDESGNIVRWYGTNLDIEDRKRREEALQAKELSWRQIVDNIPGLVATMGAMGEVEFLNRQTLEYFGKSHEDLKNWALTDAVHPDDLPRIIQARIKSIEEGTVYDVEHRCRRADGVYRWFQVRGLPVRNAEGTISAWYLLLTDIDELKRAEATLRAKELSWRQIIDNIPGFVNTAGATGAPEFFNRPEQEYFGKTSEELKDWGRIGVIHPADLPSVIEAWTNSIETGQNLDIEARFLRADGAYRWFQMRAIPARDAEGKIRDWYALHTDIEDRKRAEQRLRDSEAYLAEAQRLSQTGSWAWNPATGDIRYWSEMCYRVLGFDPTGPLPRFEEFFQRLHPDDQAASRAGFDQAIRDKTDFELDYRIVHPEKGIRDIHAVGHAVLDGSGNLSEFVGTVIDVTERKRAEQELRKSEKDLRTITDSIRQPIIVLAPDGTTLYVNQVALDLTGLSREEVHGQSFFQRVIHPDDVNRIRAKRQEGFSGGAPFELEWRARYKSGQYRWHLLQYNPLRDESGQIIRWYATATDIDDRKRAEDRLRQSEVELRTITDTIRQPISVEAPDGTYLYANRVALDNSGLTLDEVIKEGFLARRCHPDDINRVRDERRIGLLEGVPFDLETRLLYKSGQYRWCLVQYNPLTDESGQIIRWYSTATDIDDRKKTEERLHNENLVLREEIDRSSMFEEIVGSCKPMREVLKQVEKVAPSDSTVLILGETGTGKELIAHALHRRSKRANRSFIRVNCAAIPESLIASELFGHEKGAFTGALQRRVGRFEAADGGTIFLDEIGDLPVETQIALLRVLQEREFERVGSNHPISVDVRVIAATNRDLPAAVADGTFRQDLFYRLNVMPIAVPPLRERVEDIPLLVEYFVARYAKEAGKDIRHVSKHTLQQLQSYGWPGNIRELQNVVERAVILSDGDTFVVDESWLRAEVAQPNQQEGLSALGEREVEMIQAALAESHGRISGPSGAAAKLGIPRQTLESKIRRLGIDKYGQKPSTSK
jgi:formate hydrogenlyase transcriptional activator